MRKAPAVDGTALLHWIELSLPDPPWPSSEPFIGFVYLDAQAGLSAKGGRAGDPDLIERPSLTVRLPIGAPGRMLTADDVRGRGLPAAPSWLSVYGPQPPADAVWRVDPTLRGTFHPRFPDDLQVLVHDGEPRRTGKGTELCWLRVVAVDDAAARRFVGELTHPPPQPTTVPSLLSAREKYCPAETAITLDRPEGTPSEPRLFTPPPATVPSAFGATGFHQPTSEGAVPRVPGRALGVGGGGAGPRGAGCGGGEKPGSPGGAGGRRESCGSR